MKRDKLLLLKVLAVAIVYFGAAKLGLSLAFLNASVSPVWPPTGVAIAALLLFGYRALPGVSLGALAANYLLTKVTVLTTVGIATGNTLEAVTAYFLLQQFVGLQLPFYRAVDLLKFIVIAPILSTAVAATIGDLTLCLSGAAAWQNFGALWLTWWLGDAVGALIVIPLILTWAAVFTDRRPWPRIEALILFASLTISSLFVFTELFQHRNSRLPIGHLIIPVMLWAAFRFGPRGAATGLTVLSAIAVWGTVNGIGPFAQYNPNQALLFLQAYIADLGITALVLAAIVDERRVTQESLSLKETQLQLVTDTTPILLAQCSRDLRYTFVNRAYADMLGRTPDEIIGKPLVEIIGKRALKSITPYIDQVLSGQSVEYADEVEFKQIGRRNLFAAYLPDRDLKGEVRGWVASINDVTAQKQAERQLRESEVRLKLALAAGQMGAWEWDIDSGEVIWSSTLEEMHGLPVGSFGGTVDDFKRDIHPEDQATVENGIRQVLESRSQYHAVYRFIRTDGSLRWAEAFGRLSFGADSQPKKLAGVCMDITTRKLVEARERAARTEAEAANRTKDEFLANLSHELRTPLNAIVGWSSMLRSGQIDEPTAKRAVEIIDRNAKVQSQLIDDILDVSRIVSGKVRLELKPVELAKVVDAAVDSIRPAAQSRSISLHVAVDPKVAPVSGDPARLQQIVWNLLSNAVKFTPAGGQVWIQVARNDSQIEIIVNDTGQGIGADFLPHVFERFRQADGSLTRSHKGLGLGLAIVRHLVELHGGNVLAESEGEGKGATFRVILPQLTGLPKSQSTESQPAENSGMALSRVRVLLVDDEPDARELHSTILSRFGAQVQARASAVEALDLIEHWRPDVLISDLAMPEMDGYQFIAELRKIEAKNGNGNVPAVALTAHARAEDREQALQAGFQIHISKPIEPGELAKVLTSLIGRP